MLRNSLILFIFMFFLPKIAWANPSLQLLGAMVGKKTGSGVALVKNLENMQVQAFKEGQNVFGKGFLLEVKKDMMIIKDSQGKTYEISSKMKKISQASTASISVGYTGGDSYSEPGLKRVGNKTLIDKAYKEEILKKELPKILMQAASEPVLENGKISGFRLFQFEQNSMYEKIGLKDGDVVVSVHGQPLNNVVRAVQILKGLQNQNQAKVKVLRNGQEIELELGVQ